MLEAFPGARVEVRPRRSPAVDLEEPESADPAELEAPPGFRYRYRPPPEHGAARHGYRIDASGAWVEEGKASVAPYLPRFAVGHRRIPEEEREASALLDRIRTYCAQVIDRTHTVDGPEEIRILTVNESRGGLPG